MGKLNRGNTLKLSIRLSIAAKQKIEKAADNLGISKAGVILFELTKMLENPPSLSEIDQLKETITLERVNFPITVNEKTMQRVNHLSESYGVPKNVLIGLIVSAKFEDLEVKEESELDPKKLMLQVNEQLKKKIIDYSEKHYVPINALVSYSILEGPYDGFPSYEDPGQMIEIFTNVPAYIGELVKEKAKDLNIREHFYTSLCLYKQFMLPDGRFFE